jgi:Fe-S-cluster containining protein
VWTHDCFQRPFKLHDGTILTVPDLPPGELFHVLPASKRTGSCIFWERKGCAIFETRPAGCRILRPVIGPRGPECEFTALDVIAIVESWARHQTTVRAAIAEAFA